MLNKKHKLLEIKTNKLINSLFIWNYKTKHKGRWIEFADYKEYDFSDNIRDIDFIRSEKEWKTLVKLYEEEKELSIYFIFDLNDSFFEKFFSKKTKYDTLLEIFYMIWLSSIKSWNKIWVLFHNKKLFYAKKWKQNFINIINELEKNKLKNKSFFQKTFSNIVINLQNINILNYFNNLKTSKWLVFYCTDRIYLDYKQLNILSNKNDLIFCNIFNSFENSLKWKWIINSWELWVNFDLENSKKIAEYKELRFKGISALKKNIKKNNWKYLYFDESTDIYWEFYKLFKK